MSQELPADFDNPWKEMLGSYFQEFMAFFFPDVYAQIDWTRDPVFLDKELQQVAREAELGRRTVDKLVQVWKHDGESSWVLIHVEVQSQYDPDFAKRMFVYYYRLFDLYDRPIASFAVLGDERRRWRPQQFQTGLWGTLQVFTFTVAKLLDYDQAQLESDPNLFATVVLAHLKTQETDDNPPERQRWKLRLTRRLYEQGYDRGGILAVFGFIDWLMALPPELESEYWQQVQTLEQERRMPYVTTVERRGIEQGIQQGIERGIEQGIQQGIQQGIERGIERGTLTALRDSVLQVLEVRFSPLPDKLIERIRTISDVDTLQQLLRKAVIVDSVQDLGL